MERSHAAAISFCWSCCVPLGAHGGAGHREETAFWICDYFTFSMLGRAALAKPLKHSLRCCYVGQAMLACSFASRSFPTSLLESLGTAPLCVLPQPTEGLSTRLPVGMEVLAKVPVPLQCPSGFVAAMSLGESCEGCVCGRRREEDKD